MAKASESRSLQQREAQLEGTGKLRPKNKYTTPHLVEYGNLAKLTRTGLPGTAEGAMGTMCL